MEECELSTVTIPMAKYEELKYINDNIDKLKGELESKISNIEYEEWVIEIRKSHSNNRNPSDISFHTKDIVLVELNEANEWLEDLNKELKESCKSKEKAIKTLNKEIYDLKKEQPEYIPWIMLWVVIWIIGGGLMWFFSIIIDLFN